MFTMNEWIGLIMIGVMVWVVITFFMYMDRVYFWGSFIFGGCVVFVLGWLLVGFKLLIGS